MSSGFIIDDTIQNGATSSEIFSMINERRSLIGDVPEYYDLITSNIITDVLIPYDTKALRNTALNSYTTTTSLNTLLSGKEATLTFNAPLTRSTNTISLDLSSYDTIALRNTALSNYTTTSGLNTLLSSYSTTTATANLYLNSNQLASQQFINSNSVSLNYLQKRAGDYVGIGITNPSYKLQVEDGSLFVGDSAYASTSLSTANGFRLFFDSTFNGTAGAGIPANKIVLHNSGGTWLGGFGLENSSVTYHSTANHTFYTGNTATAYGTRRMILNTNGNLEITGQFITYSSGNGYMTLNQGNSTVTGYLEFKNAAGTRMGYIGNVAAGGYIQLQSESTCVGYSMNGNLTVAGTASITGVLTANSISSTGLVNTYINSNQLASQQFINSNSIALNYLPIAGGGNVNINGILKFGSRVQDYLIDLYGGTYGFGINASTLRYNSYSAHKFYSSATNTFTIDTSGNVTALATINGATLQQGGVGVSTLITNALASYLPLTGSTISGTLNLNSSTQLQSRINLTGQEFYVAGNTSTDGIALLLGVNRTGNRQLWIADTANLTQNATNSVIRITPGGYIDCIATNGTTPLPLIITGSTLTLSPATTCSSTLTVTGTLTANTISSTGLTASLATKEAVLTFSSPLVRTVNTISVDLSGLSGLTSNQLASQNYLQTKLNGFVGIGTAPNYTLDAYGTDNFIGRCKIDGGGHDANKVDDFGIGRGDGSTKEFTGIKVCCTLGSTVGETYSNHTHINFWTWGNNIAGSREVARITSRGRLGIGSTLPAFEIDTSGSIRATNQILAYAGAGNGYIVLNNGGTGATGYLGIHNPSGTRCCYFGAMNNANTYMPIVAESPCVGFDFSGKLKVYGNLLNDYYFNNNGNPHATLQDFNNITTFGYNFIQGTTNAPTYNSVVANGAGQFYSWSCGLGSEYAYSTYVCQMAVGRNVANPYLNVRYRENGGWGGWNKIASGLADTATLANNLTGTPNITVGTISAGATTLSSTLSVSGVTTLANGVWHKSGEGHNRFHFGTNDKTYFGGNGYTFRSNNDSVDVFNITDGGAITASSTIIASGAITGQQYVNNYSTLYSTTVGGAYGIFYPVTRWLSNGSTFFVSYTIKIFTNGGGSVETTGTFWGNSSSGIVGATASWSNGMAIASEPFYDSGTFYWRFFNTNLSLFGGYSYYKFIG